MTSFLRWFHGPCKRPWYNGGHHYHYIRYEHRSAKCAATGTEYNYTEQFNLYKCCLCLTEKWELNNY